MTYQLSLEGKTGLITAAGQGLECPSLLGMFAMQTKLQRFKFA